MATPPGPAVSSSTGDKVAAAGILITSRQFWAFGGLLLATGLLAFGLGWKFGIASATSMKSMPDGPVVLSGQVHGNSGEAVLICFSANNRPEQKQEVWHATVEQLLSDQSLSESLQQFGAKLVQVSGAGRFRVEMPTPGEHFLLVLTDPGGRPPERPTTETLARLGRYFLRGDQLLGRFRWSWSEIKLSVDEEIAIDM